MSTLRTLLARMLTARMISSNDATVPRTEQTPLDARAYQASRVQAHVIRHVNRQFVRLLVDITCRALDLFMHIVEKCETKWNVHIRKSSVLCDEL